VALSVAIGDKRVGASEKVSGSKSPPIPLNVDVEAAQEAVVWWLQIAAARIAEKLGIDEPEAQSRITTEHARIVEACVRLLRPHVDTLLASPEDSVRVWRRTGESSSFVDKSGIDIAAELVRAHRNARRILGATTPRFRLSMPCPACSSPSLFRRVDKTDAGVRDEVSCDACRVMWTHDHYLRLVSIFVADEQERQEREDMAINLELQQRAELAEYLLAEKVWQMSLARDCTDISAADFFTALEAA
jgi:hypothetical protein